MGILTGRGINAQRKILSPNYDERKESRDNQTESLIPAFLRAVVVDVLTNPEFLDEDFKEELRTNATNPEFLESAPRNSILARIVSRGADHRDNSFTILYPFLPPHLQMPIKPGEQCWVMFENPEGILDLGYWCWRVSDNVQVDDINFTHNDRRFLNEDELKGKTPSFPNGGGNENNKTLLEEDAYETIEDGSQANEIITKEKVPRYTKRPGDAVLQGSNNTLIVLGEDRPGDINEEAQKGEAGTIDIVAGRGKMENTKAPEVVNERNQKEVDKFPSSQNTKNENEGNPDFINDDSRLYLSMKTNGDANFEIDGKFPKLNSGQSVEAITDSAFSILKSKEIRVIAKDDGSIRFIKEGSNKATIVMMPNGNVMIEGAQIILGTGKQNQVYLGTDAQESLILGDTFIRNLDLFLTQFLSIIVPPNTAATPATGFIAPAWAGLIPVINAFKAQLQTFLSRTSKTK